AALLLAVPQAAARTLEPLPVLRRGPIRTISTGLLPGILSVHRGGALSSPTAIESPERIFFMSFAGTGKIWMNGTLVDWKDATIHVASHVVHYGSAVFEGARCYATPKGSACFRLDAHMRRLQ